MEEERIRICPPPEEFDPDPAAHGNYYVGYTKMERKKVGFCLSYVV